MSHGILICMWLDRNYFILGIKKARKLIVCGLVDIGIYTCFESTFKFFLKFLAKFIKAQKLNLSKN